MSNNEQLSFTPNEELINILASLSISRNAAIRALYNTGNYNADMAAAWVFENQHQNLDLPLTQDNLAVEESGEEDDGEDFVTLASGQDEEIKMVLVVNTSLSMGLGKMAAQVGHGAVGLYKELLEKQETYAELLLCWDDCGSKKIVLKGESALHLQELDKKAQALKLPTYSVFDAGRTQIEAGSYTVLAVIGRNGEVDKVTGGLSLL